MKKIIDHTKINLIFDFKNFAKLLINNIIAETNCSRALLFFKNNSTLKFNIIEFTGFSIERINNFKNCLAAFSKQNEFEVISATQKAELFYLIKQHLYSSVNLAFIFQINHYYDFSGLLLILTDKPLEIELSEFKSIVENHIQILKSNLQPEIFEAVSDFDMIDETALAYTQDYLYEQIYRHIIEAEHLNAKFTIALLEIDNYNNLFKKNANLATQLLQDLTAFLSKNIRRIDTLAMMFNTIIAIIFPDLSEEAVEAKIKELLLKIEKADFIEEYQKDIDVEHLQINYGFANFPKDGKTTELLIRNAFRDLTQKNLNTKK